MASSALLLVLCGVGTTCLILCILWIAFQMLKKHDQNQKRTAISTRSIAQGSAYVTITPKSILHVSFVQEEDDDNAPRYQRNRQLSVWNDPFFRQFHISPSTLLLQDRVIGQGRHTEVLYGLYGHQEVAIKRLLPSFPPNELMFEAFWDEIQVACVVFHAQIVSFVGIVWDDRCCNESLALVTEYMGGGNLHQVLQTLPSSAFNRWKAQVAMQILQGLRYLHACHPVVQHGHLTAQSVLFSMDYNHIKLCDVGSTISTQYAMGACLYTAPEVLVGSRSDESADLYSFGVLLSQLDTHQDPYGAPIPTKQEILSGKRCCSFGTTDLEKLGTACLSMEPAARPTAAEALIVLQTITL